MSEAGLEYERFAFHTILCPGLDLVTEMPAKMCWLAGMWYWKDPVGPRLMFCSDIVSSAHGIAQLVSFFPASSSTVEPIQMLEGFKIGTIYLQSMVVYVYTMQRFV